MLQKPIVINLFGAPGAGKSTAAAKVFYELKRRGYNCQLVSEVAKDLTWQHNNTALTCQQYVFGLQSYRLHRLCGQVDFVVTDSPLPLTILYNTNEILAKSFEDVVFSVFKSYNNINYIINRAGIYSCVGRNQTEQQSDQLFIRLCNLLNQHAIQFREVPGTDKGVQQILQQLVYLT